MGRHAERRACFRYMQWWRKEHHSAGWRIGLDRMMAEACDGVFEWPVEQSGCWWV